MDFEIYGVAAGIVFGAGGCRPGTVRGCRRDEGQRGGTRVTAIDFDECEPYQVRAQIMDLYPEKGTIVVAEREIRALDVGSGENRSRRIPHDGRQTGIADRLQSRPIRVGQGGASPRRICGRLCGAENR